jgi:hypothetical protein
MNSSTRRCHCVTLQSSVVRRACHTPGPRMKLTMASGVHESRIRRRLGGMHTRQIWDLLDLQLALCFMQLFLVLAACSSPVGLLPLVLIMFLPGAVDMGPYIVDISSVVPHYPCRIYALAYPLRTADLLEPALTGTHR